jgi:hypothetical protein
MEETVEERRGDDGIAEEYPFAVGRLALISVPG